jgi:hypothetical protein
MHPGVFSVYFDEWRPGLSHATSIIRACGQSCGRRDMLRVQRGRVRNLVEKPDRGSAGYERRSLPKDSRMSVATGSAKDRIVPAGEETAATQRVIPERYAEPGKGVEKPGIGGVMQVGARNRHHPNSIRPSCRILS